jgi:hypothetical protein
MKTPVSLTWIPSLFLALAWMPDSVAQNSPDGPPISAPATAVVTPASPTTDLLTIQLSHGATEIVKLAQARIQESTVLTFIGNAGPFNLDPDQIIHMKELGVSAPILAAMLRRDLELGSAKRPLAAAGEPASQSAAVSPASSTPAASELTQIEKPSPEAARTITDPQLAAQQLPVTQQPESASQSSFIESRPAPNKKRSLYPVREPYPVEITAPIVFVQAAEITPNTLVIVGFPPTDP